MTTAATTTVMAAAVLLGSANSAAGQVVRTVSFDTDPGWAAVGSGANGNNFGYQSSTFAGGNPGEGGGRFTRTAAVRHYADTGLGGVLTLNGPLGAAGRFDFTAANIPDFGPGLAMGHFRTTAVSSIGLLFNNQAGSLYWNAKIRLVDGTEVSGPNNIIAPNIDRTWSYSWDPLGGTLGGGRLTATLSGPGGGTQLVDVTPAQRAVGATFDAFGLNSLPASSSDATMYADVFVDDLSYTAVPEPPALALVGLALALWRVARVRRAG